jgi:hypothetical protein
MQICFNNFITYPPSLIGHEDEPISKANKLIKPEDVNSFMHFVWFFIFYAFV